MQYVYTLMWLVVGLLLIFQLGRKEDKVFYAAGAFFLFLAGWWGTAAFTKLDLFHGTWGWILRGVAAVFLLILVPPFVKKYRRERSQPRQEPPEDMTGVDCVTHAYEDEEKQKGKKNYEAENRTNN